MRAAAAVIYTGVWPCWRGGNLDGKLEAKFWMAAAIGVAAAGLMALFGFRHFYRGFACFCAYLWRPRFA